MTLSNISRLILRFWTAKNLMVGYMERLRRTYVLNAALSIALTVITVFITHGYKSRNRKSNHNRPERHDSPVRNVRATAFTLSG